MAELDPRSVLIHAYLDGGATEAQLVELGVLLAADPQAADEFVAAVRLDLLLESHFVEQREESEWRAELSPAPTPARRPRRVAVATGAVVSIALSIALVAIVWQPPKLSSGAVSARVVSGTIDVSGVSVAAIPIDTPFRVSGTSNAIIRLADGCDIRLLPATTGILRREGNAAVVELTDGGGEFHFDQACALRVDTHAGSIVAKNASFQVETQSSVPSGATSMTSSVMTLLTVAVLTGQVEVLGAQKNVKVSAGQKQVFSSEKVPKFTGRVVAVSADGKQLTLEGTSPKPGVPAPRQELAITDKTKVQYHGVYQGGDQPRVGYQAEAVLDQTLPLQTLPRRTSPLRALRIEFGNPQADVTGTVVEVGDQEQSVTVEVLRKNAPPQHRTIQIGERTRVLLVDETESRQLAVGDRVEAWLGPDSNSAIEIRVQANSKGKPKPSAKPGSGTPKTGKPAGKKKLAPSPKPYKSTLENPKPKTSTPAKSPKKTSSLEPGGHNEQRRIVNQGEFVIEEVVS